jgi:hypothetical protein
MYRRMSPLAGTGVPGPPLCKFGLSLARVDKEDGTREPTTLSFGKGLIRLMRAIPPLPTLLIAWSPTVVLPEADIGAGEAREDVV